jgi:hypothetical protein
MKNKLSRQQIIFIILLLVAAATIALFETGVLPTGGLTAYDGNMRYIIDVAVFMLTIGLIPLAAKRFDASIEKVKNCDDEVLLTTYRRESEIQLALLFVVMMMNIGAYYGSGNESMIYCALAGFVRYIFCFPSNKALQRAKE